MPSLRQALKDQPGALVLCDSFEGPSAHGAIVAQVARQQGFQGKLVALPFEDPNDPVQTEIQRSVQAWGEAQDPSEICACLAESMVLTRLSALGAATQRLLAVTETGARQVVVNFSLGSSAAMCVAAVLAMSEDATAARQLEKAFGADFRSGLVELAGQASSDPRLQEAREDFATVVRAFEAKGNSVVVAAGNDGRMGDWGAGFSRSDLSTPETTVVGALEGAKPAPYNSEGFTLLAQGGFRIGTEEVHGTSFAAPVVAAAMATAHARFPQADSRQIEARLEFPRSL